MAQRRSGWRGVGLWRTKREIFGVLIAYTVALNESPELLISHSAILMKSTIKFFLTSNSALVLWNSSILVIGIDIDLNRQ